MHGVNSVVAEARRVIGIVLVAGGETLDGWIEALQARGMRANPYRYLRVLLDGDIDLGRALRVELIHGGVRSRRIETIETIEGGGPQPTGMIDEQLSHIIAAQTKWIGWAVPELLEQSGLRVVTDQSKAAGTNPKKTRSISDDGSRARTDSWPYGPVEGVLSGVAVDAVERVNGGNPQDSLAILIDAIHHRAAHAVGVSGLVLEFLKERRSSGQAGVRHHVKARPDVSFSILKQGSHIVLAETIRVGGIMTVADEFPLLAVELEKAIAQGRKLQSPVAIFEHRHHAGWERVIEAPPIERIVSERSRCSIENLQPASGDMDDPEHAVAVLMERHLAVFM